MKKKKKPIKTHRFISSLVVFHHKIDIQTNMFEAKYMSSSIGGGGRGAFGVGISDGIR